MRSIPSDVLAFYTPLGWRVALYAKLRWRLCPFEKIESHVPPEGQIIDLGCGYGLLSNLMANRSSRRQILGVDLSAGRIAIAEKTVGARKNVRFVCQDVRQFQMPKSNAIVITDALHHMPFDLQDQILSLAYAALVPGGRLVILDVDRDRFWWKFWCVYAADRILNPTDRLYHVSKEELASRCRRAGFNVAVVPAHEGLALSDFLFLCDRPV